MRPEMPYLMAGGITLAGGVARHKTFPPDGVTAVIGTLVLVIIAASTSDTPIAPLVRAIGFLLVMVAIMASIKYFRK